MRFCICFLIAGLLITACDPARRITMKNSTADTAQIIFKAREDSIGWNPFVMNNSRELSFTLPPNDSKGISLPFGIGSWTPAYVESLMRHLVSIELVSKNKTTKMDSAAILRDYFLSHRKKRGTVVEFLIE